ncbi:MAG: DUF4870 domain-containing protein [Archangiaceae bacterium]|nr:DUF4870 domain-containing protein [Archangiaceae bacterium]
MANDSLVPTITPADKNLAALAHLSGLAGYVVPLGGALVPIIIMMTASSKTVVSIARQALLLNVAAYLGALLVFGAYFTLLLIPCAALFGLLLAAAVVVLPIVGAVKALDGRYYRYPVIGVSQPLG